MNTLSDKAYKAVENLIVTLELKPGTFFSETELCKKLNIGRTPLREALKRLCSDGLLQTIPRKGMFVTEVNAYEQLLLLETRYALDNLVIKNALKNITEDQKNLLQTCHEKILEAMETENLDQYIEYDAIFDGILEEASKNKYAVNAVKPLHIHSKRFWFYHQKHSRFQEIAKIHADIVDAVLANSEEKVEETLLALYNYLISFTKKALN